jgi:flagellar M-ring protein FliF
MKPTGTQRRLSVAVLVDGKTVKSTDKDGKVLTKVDPWPPEKLKEFEDIVASTVGIDKKRGDVLEIKNIEFTREDFDEVQKAIAERERKAYVQNMVLYGVIGLTVLLFFLFVVRPFIKWITENTVDNVDTFLPQTIEELEKLQKNSALPGLEDSVPVLPEKIDPEKVEGEMLKEKIVTLIDQNPHKAALILKDWLHTEKPKPSEKEVGGKSKSASA